MCEYWIYSCGHTFKTPCKLPKLENQPMRNKLATVPENGSALIRYDLNCAQQRLGESKPLDPSRCCPGFPEKPKETEDKCFPCLSHDEGAKMQSVRPHVERLRIKREGAGNDNWGFSSQGMVGFGQGGNSSWLDQYDNQNGGFGTYLGGGRVMPDKRQPRQMMTPQHGPAPGMRVMPPGGIQSWPFGQGGIMSTNPSSAGGYSTSSSAVNFGSSASTNAVRSDSEASTSSSSNGSFMNPWANPKSDMGHIGMPGGRLPAGYGNGVFMPLQQPQPGSGVYALPPQPGTGEARMQHNAFEDRRVSRERYRSV